MARVVGVGEDRLPNESATDIVTFAGHVVVVTVTGDEELPVPREEIDRGEGLMLRSVRLSVDEVLWSSQAARPAPQTLRWRGLGWQFKGDDRTVVAAEDSPRFDVGHTYIVALDWDQPNCAKAGHWTTLGGSFNAPYEDETIGLGEFEGQVLAKSTMADERPPGTSLRSTLWGGSSADVVKALRAARPSPELVKTRRQVEEHC